MGDKMFVVYDVTEAAIQEKRGRYESLTADTAQGYENVRIAIADLRATRGAVEKRRKELKADSLAFGRQVDAVAEYLTKQLEAIEIPLKERKALVDQEKERARASEEEAKQRAWQEQLRADQAEAAERNRIEKERLEAERAALEAERAEVARQQEAAAAVQRATLEAERAELERQQRAAAAVQMAEQQRISDERRAMEAERAVLEAARREQECAERQRLAAIEAQATAERERADAEAAKQAEAARLEAMRPDFEKILSFAMQLRQLAASAPIMTTPETQMALAGTCHQLHLLANKLHEFVGDDRNQDPADGDFNV